MTIDCLKDKTILVTGGTGSFGKNFIRHLLDESQAKKIIIFSRDELKQFNMQKDFNNDERLRFFIGDVRDKERVERAFHGVDVVVHAAALKQVPTIEYNPFEAVKTNILGSQNVINAAIDQGVDKVLLVSTDKAAQPANLYGSTKLCAEKLFISGNAYAGAKTKFSCVRYGNVIGSRGSIVETLLNIQEGEKVYITDDRMTRFWLMIEDSFKLVLFALDNMVGGEIFIPKVPSMKIIDIINVLAPGVEQEIIGIRPGEKLHEILLTAEESRHAISYDKYFVIIPEHKEIFNYDNFRKYLDHGEKLNNDYFYGSDTNEEWLTNNDFKNIIEKLKI